MGSLRVVGLSAAFFLAVLGACGDDDETESASTDDTSAEADDPVASDDVDGEDDGSDGSDGSDPAPEGQIILEVNGESFTADIETCQLEEQGAIAILSAPGADPAINLNLGRSGTDTFGTLNAGVTDGNGETLYGVSGVAGDVMIDGRNIVVESAGFFDPSNPGETHEGVLRATCT